MNYFLNYESVDDQPDSIDKYVDRWFFLQGCFETVLIKNCLAQDLDLHLLRAKKTNTEIFKTHYEYDDIKAAVKAAIQNLCSVNKKYKLKLIFSEENIFYSIELYAPKFPPRIILESIDASSEFQYLLTNHKLCDYKAHLNLLASANASSWDVVRRNDQELLEGTKVNIFFCKRGEIFTPKAGDLLPGIIRQRLLEKKVVKESNIFLPSLGDFDGMFITNSLIEILPVDQLDNLFFKHSQDYVRELQKHIF